MDFTKGITLETSKLHFGTKGITLETKGPHLGLWVPPGTRDKMTQPSQVRIYFWPQNTDYFFGAAGSLQNLVLIVFFF